MGKNFTMNGDSLFVLIHSLSQNEKGYVKKSAFGSKQKIENGYIKLFDAIASQDEYDEAEILKKLKGDSVCTYFSKNKNYLYHLILKKLTQYHEENINEFKIKSISNQALILFKKGLFKEAVTHYGKALKHALDDEEYIVALDVYNKILTIYLSGDMGTTFPYRIEMQEVSNKIKKETDFNSLYCSLIELMFIDKVGNKTLIEESVNTILSNTLINNVSSTDSFKTQWYALSILSLGNYLLNKHEKANEYREKQGLLLSSNKKLAMKEPARYVSHLANSISNKMNIGELQEIPDLLAQLKELDIDPNIEKRSDLTRFAIYHIQTITYYTKTGDFSSALKHLDEMIPWLEDNNGAISEYITLVAYDKIFFTYFGNKEYRKALQWLNRINNSKSSFRQEFQFSSKFHLLMLHFELKNNDLIESIVRNIYREMLKSSLDLQAEKLILRWFQKNLKNIAPDTRLNREAFRDIKEKIQSMNSESHWKLIKNLHVFEVWLDSKITNKEIAELYKKSNESIKMEMDKA